MCGRFTLAVDPSLLLKLFPGLVLPSDLVPRFNVAPTQPVLGIFGARGKHAENFHWGLIPFWAKNKGIGASMINARAESLAEKPAFRRAFEKRRLLIPADGFYEWRKDGKVRTPFYIRMKTGEPFAFAGVWEKWASKDAPEDAVRSASIITVAANELVAPLHDRMPAIIPAADFERWLDPENEQPAALLKPYDADPMTMYEVSRVVNNANNETPECVAPVEEEPTLF